LKQSKLAFYDQACNIQEKNNLLGISRPVPSSKAGHYHLSARRNKNLFSLLPTGSKDNSSLHLTFSEKTQKSISQDLSHYCDTFLKVGLLLKVTSYTFPRNSHVEV